MNAASLIPAVQRPGPIASREPVVFVDGVPEPSLAVARWTSTAPLDARTVELHINPDVDQATLDRWCRAELTIALPHRLPGFQSAWQLLARGRVVNRSDTASPMARKRSITLFDSWSQRMALQPQFAWVQGDEQLLAAHPSLALLRIGEATNRSNRRWTISGCSVHVLQDHGQAWTLGEALRTIFAFASLNVSVDLIPLEVAELPLVETLDLSNGIAAALAPLLRSAGLVIHRETHLHAGQVSESTCVMPQSLGRIVKFADAPKAALGDRRSWNDRAGRDLARQWIVRSPGRRIEGTFQLQPGWNSSLAGGADALYSKSTSSSFSTYGDVFRLWVLNEDGRFTGEPFGNAAAFDLPAFFNDPALPRGPLKFLDCLTLSDAGLPRPVGVEISSDSGGSWSPYPGIVLVRHDRAAVYLDDNALPPAFLVACKIGNGRVRATASLQSPVPVEARRWRGNPFVAQQGDHVILQADHFMFRSVGPSSVNFAGVHAGTLAADQRDDSLAQRAFLRESLLRARLNSAGRPVSQVTLAGARPWIEAGDRWVDGRIVNRVDCRWPGLEEHPTESSLSTMLELLAP